MINFTNFQYFIRPDFFRERTVWFIPWKIHDTVWHGLSSSGNELCSSFPEEVRPCQALPWLLQGMNNTVLSLKKSRAIKWPDWFLQGRNYTVYSLKKSGHVRPCHEFFREWTIQFFPGKKSGFRKYWKLQWSCQPCRTVSLHLLVVLFFDNFLTRVFRRLDVACRCGLAFIRVFAWTRRILAKFYKNVRKCYAHFRHFRKCMWKLMELCENITNCRKCVCGFLPG